jgi:hypothetical protein
MRLVAPAALSLLLLACAAPRDIPQAPPESCDVPSTTLPAGDVAGDFCGNLTAEGSLTVRETLRLGAGSVLVIPAAEEIRVDGVLELNGTKEWPIHLLSQDGWNGITVNGTLRATFAKISGQFGAIQQNSGLVEMSDTQLDLLSPVTGQDCTNVDGGAMTLDHVHITGCHCPIHINASTGPVSISGSILDGASNPIMIGSTEGAEVHGNHLLGVLAPLLDLGGGVRGSFSGNYYGGGAPNVESPDPSQFAGADDYEREEIPGVGPRF